MAFAIAWPALTTVQVALERPAQVAADEEIEPPIVVEIEEPGAGAPAVRRHAGARGDVAERVVAVVVVQDVAACWVT
jgi:hypothetical protein